MVYTYTSTRADYDPAKLFIVCPPSGQAAAEPEAAAFAEASGWKAPDDPGGAGRLESRNR